MMVIKTGNHTPKLKIEYRDQLTKHVCKVTSVFIHWHLLSVHKETLLQKSSQFMPHYITESYSEAPFNK